MAETKDDIAAERDRLRAENDRLKGQLAAAGAAQGAYRPQQQFMLSEGDRQELALHGVVNVGGRLLTRDEVAAKLSWEQRGLDLGDAEPIPGTVQAPRTSAVEGVDFIYPSVAPGLIDPAVAGTPGISGPPATDTTPPATDTTGS